MEKGNKLFKGLVVLMIVLFAIGFVLKLYNDHIQKKEQEVFVNTVMPKIEKRIEQIIEANSDIIEIKPYFEYGGVNFIELYVADTWIFVTDIEKIRFAKDVRDNVKTILFEEGFIKANERVGIYVYSVDGIKLAESNIHDEIKLESTH